MEPLATINGSSPLIAPQAQVVSLGAPRGSQEERAVGKERAVELVHDRVDPEDPVAQSRRPRQAPATGIEPQQDDRAQQDRRPSTRELPFAPAAKNQAVTYRVIQDLNRTQGQVVDRQDSEVVRSVPSEPQIELAQRYQEYIGKNIDTLA